MISSSGGCAHLSLPTGDTVYQYSVALFKCDSSITSVCAKCKRFWNFRILAQPSFCASCTINSNFADYGSFTKFLHNIFGRKDPSGSFRLNAFYYCKFCLVCLASASGLVLHENRSRHKGKMDFQNLVGMYHDFLCDSLV